MASRLRTAETVYDEEHIMSDPEQPDLVIEAYGTVTPPPEPDPDEEKNS